MNPANPNTADPQGIVSLVSPYAFADTVQRLLAAFTEKGIKVFATIDQQAEARTVGLEMPPTTLIVFGNPKGARRSCWPIRRQASICR
jgi:uncharacterized protein (DUF302 family)